MGFTDLTLIREALHFWRGDVEMAVSYIINRKNREPIYGGGGGIGGYDRHNMGADGGGGMMEDHHPLQMGRRHPHQRPGRRTDPGIRKWTNRLKCRI